MSPFHTWEAFQCSFFGWNGTSSSPRSEYSPEIRNAPVRPNRPDEVEREGMERKNQRVSHLPTLRSPFLPPRPHPPAPPLAPELARPAPAPELGRPTPAPPVAPTPAPPLALTPAPPLALPPALRLASPPAPPQPTHVEARTRRDQAATDDPGAGTHAEDASRSSDGRRSARATRNHDPGSIQSLLSVFFFPEISSRLIHMSNIKSMIFPYNI